MSVRGNYPPSHRDVRKPQPEVCDLCGTIVPGAQLMQSDVEGLRDRLICSTTPGCRAQRNRLSWKDRRRFNPRDHSYIGNSRVYPAGAPAWGQNPPPSLTAPIELMTNEGDMLQFNDGSRVVVNG